MTKEQAFTRIATLLAINTYDHMQSAITIPNLAQNAKEAGDKNRNACEAIGCVNLYDASLARMINGG